MQKIIDGKRYDTETATLIGDTRQWNGRNYSTRWTALYRSPRGRWFTVGYSQWQGEPWGAFDPISEHDARRVYESLVDPELSYSEAFGEEPEIA